MTRVKRSVHARKKRRSTLKQAKGYFGRKKSSYRFAKEQVQRSGAGVLAAMGGPKSVACPQSLRCRQSQMEELLQPSVEAICMALFGIVERLSAAGMGAALEEAARGFEVFGELAEIGRVVLVATRALDGRAASLLGWRLAAERGARARHHALHRPDQ